ncbi:MAG: PAS domain S-box protein, partial [Cyanobacteria bacterium SZAS LIN-2]|nr:PAS domain S-box protein [Cyanobacteria bacterium SZAS LIN-2]
EHKQALDRLKAGDKTGFTMIYAPMQQHFEQLLSLCDSLTTQQTKNEGLDVDKYGEMIRLVLCLSIAVSLMLAAFLAYIFNHGTADRLKVILDNTRRMAAGKAPDKKLGGDDELAEIDNMYHDMHESLTILRRRERAILENVADVVCSIDSNMRFTDINDAAQKHWGYKNDDLVGSRPAEIVAPEDREMVSQALNAAIEAGQEARFECSVLRQDGTTADTEWSVTWSAEESSLYCIVHDISARKHLDRMKRDFVAMISHEIRTPLTAIQLTHSFLLMEMEEALDEMSVQSLNEAQDNVNRLMAMVNNLLDLDKLESGCVEFVAETTEARALIEKSINAIDSLFRQKSITVSANIDPAITFYADKDRIVQVMINLLANAIKYSPSKSEITVKARTQGNFVRVEISDQGRGIPPDKLQTIFERFRQVEAADAREHKGIGLGLAISKAIVERHKGQMGVESVPGRGSTFWFTIPASEKVYLEV